ncbi:MAG: hypothetical protein ABIH53_00325 [archaeon]
MNILLKTLAVFTLVSASMKGCDTFESISENKFKKAGWSQEQSEVGTAVAYRKPFTEKIQQDDGTAVYKLNYGGVTEEDVLQHVQKTHQDLEEIADSDLNIPTIKYLQKTSMGKHLVKQEKVYHYLEDALSRKILHRRFLELSQQIRRNPGYDPLNVNEEDKYSITTIFPINQEPMEFDMNYVKSAIAEGKLNDPSTIVESLTEVYTYFEKVNNPKYPKIDKYEEFIFKKRKMDIKITSYNLDNDKEMEADYVELFRLKEDGNQESIPAVKVFKPNGTGNLELIVADKDPEGTPGYGIPDLVQTIQISIGSDLTTLGIEEFIFESSQKDKPVLVDFDKESEVYIVKSGTLLAEKYDMNFEGWESSLPSYKSGDNAKKVSVHIKLTGDENDELRKIEWIAKQYPDTNRTVEFYKLNETFKEEEYAFVKSNEKSISLMGSTGQIKQYAVEAILEDKPFRIDFDKSKQKRWILLDQDKDGVTFEAKREISWSRDVIPK